MNKKINKIISSASTIAATATAMTPVIILTNNNTNSSVSKINSSYADKGNQINTRKIIFGGKEYENAEEAANDYINQAGNVDQNVYVGNVDDATSKSSPYKTIDLSKLKQNDPTKISKAYKKLSGEYTSNEDKAKESYLKEAQIKFSDNNGGIFDLETDAKESISKSKLTSSVTYYEIEDHNRIDKFGNPEIVKINPLNKNDLEKLKRLALENAVLNSSSGFDIERFTNQGNKTYSKSTENGISVEEYNSIMNRINDIVLENIKKKIWVSPTLSVTPEKNQMDTFFGGGLGIIPTRFGVSYTTHASSSNIYKGVSIEKLMSDSHALYNSKAFDERFDTYGETYGNTNGKGGALFRDAKTKGHYDFLDGQEYNFTFDNQEFIQKNFYNAHPGEAISFVGKGIENNVWFNLGFNQEKLEENLRSNPSFYRKIQSYATSSANEIAKSVRQIIPGINIDEITWKLRDPIAKILNTKLISNNQFELRNFRNPNSIINHLNVLDEKIIGILNEEIKKSFGDVSSVEDFFGKYVQREKMINETFDENEVNSIYSITYNGTPLFRLNSSIMNNHANLIEFKSTPVETLKIEIKKALTNDYEGTMKSYIPNMENVSNMLSREIYSGNKLTNEVHIGYFSKRSNETIAKTIGFTSGEVDESWGLKDDNVYFDESMISKLGITKLNLERQLSLFESDGRNTLKMNSGTWGAIYQYNKELKHALTTKDPNEAFKNNILKNRVTNLNDVVQLFEKDKSPKNIYYGEYLNYNNTFNPSLSTENARILSSYEAKDYAINLHGLNTPSRVIQVSNHNNDLLVSKVITDNTQDGINAAKELAINEAKANINISHDDKYVVYKENSGTEVVLENIFTNLYTLKLKDKNNIIKATYGFLDYQNLYKYLVDYIKFNATEGGSSIDKVVPFTPDTIDLKKLEAGLNSFDTLEAANNASNQEKFNKFGSAFGIGQNDWNLMINTITFVKKSTRNSQAVSMDVSLKSGYKLPNGNTTFSKDATFTPGLVDLPGVGGDSDLDAIQRNASNATIISVTAAILSIIILEVIVIVTILLNRRNQEQEVENKIIRIANSRPTTTTLNLNRNWKPTTISTGVPGQKLTINTPTTSSVKINNMNTSGSVGTKSENKNPFGFISKIPFISNLKKDKENKKDVVTTKSTTTKTIETKKPEDKLLDNKSTTTIVKTVETKPITTTKVETKSTDNKIVETKPTTTTTVKTIETKPVEKVEAKNVESNNTVVTTKKVETTTTVSDKK